MFSIAKDETTGEFAATDGKSSEFLELPTGDFIRPMHVEAIRLQAQKADGRTGEIAYRVHIDHRGSWFTVAFAEAGEAKSWSRALADLCNRIARGEPMGDDAPVAFDRKSMRAAISAMGGNT